MVGDFGAHRGYIISRVGFQTGAFAAVQHTNVELLTFDQLQTIFVDRWRVAMGQKYRPAADVLFPYWDYPGKMPQFQWQQQHVDQQRLLIDAYYPILHIGPLFAMQGSIWTLPMTLPALDANGNRIGDITLSTYREVYDFIDTHKDLALRHFRILYGEIQP